MARIEIWVNFAGTGKQNNPYRPDLPLFVCPHHLDMSKLMQFVNARVPAEHAFNLGDVEVENYVLAGIHKQQPNADANQILTDLRNEIDRTSWETRQSLVEDLVDDRDFAITRCNVIVRDDWLPDIRAHLKNKHGPTADYALFDNGNEFDVLLVNMVRKFRLTMDEHRDCANDADVITKRQKKADREADAFFDAIPNIATADIVRKTEIKKVLVQAVARGLSAAKAEEIHTKHNLPEASTIGR